MTGGVENHDASYEEIVRLGLMPRDAQTHFGIALAVGSPPDRLLFELTLRPDPSEPDLSLEIHDFHGNPILLAP